MNELEHERIVQQLNEAHALEVARLQYDLDRARESLVPLQQRVDELTTELVAKTAVLDTIRGLVA